MLKKKIQGSSDDRVLVIVAVVIAVGVGSIAVLAILAGLLLPALSKAREEARKLKCRNNLKQLATALNQYIDHMGGSRFLPYIENQQTGAEFLVAVYWSGIVDEPRLYICPSSSDDNNLGADLGSSRNDPTRATRSDWERACSYASRLRGPGQRPLTDTFPAATALACDDTEGKPHHCGLNVIFFDTHAEFFMDLDPGPGADGAVGNDEPVDVLRN